MHGLLFLLLILLQMVVPLHFLLRYYRSVVFSVASAPACCIANAALTIGVTAATCAAAGAALQLLTAPALASGTAMVKFTHYAAAVCAS